MASHENMRFYDPLPPNTSFERPLSVGGPRLAAAEASWPAAQLNR